jgi:hypothetical protein
MKSPLKKSIGEVVTDYGARVMKVFKKGLLQRSLFDFYGDVKADKLRVKESSSVPATPVDGDGGVMYTKSADGKLYYKSNEVSEVELSASDTVLTSEQVQDIVGGMFSGNTETNITVTYQDADGTIDLAATDTNTTYSEATGSAEGLMSIAHHDKLDGIETGADVTDTTNVTAAGALMDSELTDLAGVKSLDTSTLVTLAGTQSITGGKTFTKPLILDGDKSVTAGSDGVTLHVDAQDITDSSTSGSGTAASFNHVVVENPRLMATNSSVTTTNASTVYIKGAPVASTNQTITNAYALYVAAGASYFGSSGITTSGIITGKQRQIYQQSFIDDLGTTKHYLPWKDINEQTTIYQEEVAMIAPYDGRIVSVTMRMSSVASTGNRTIGIHTVGPNTSQFTGGNWTEEEVEQVAISNTDDNHVFYFVFDNAKHFESGELVTLSIQDDADLHTGSRYCYVSTVVEWDYNNGLGTGASSAEYDSAQ